MRIKRTPDGGIAADDGKDSNEDTSSKEPEAAAPVPPPEAVASSGEQPGGASGMVHQNAELADLPSPVPATDQGDIERYIVVRGGPVHIPGLGRTEIRPGKPVDSRHYSIELLRKQGIELRAVDVDTNMQAHTRASGALRKF